MLRKNGESSISRTARALALGRLILAAEPVLEGERQEVPDIDDFGRLAFDDGGAEHAGIFAGDLDIEAVFDDIDNLVDHQRHRAVAIREHQQRLGALALYAYGRIHADQRHQLTAVLHHVAAVRQFDLAGIDFLEPGNQRQRHGLELGGAGAEHEQRRGLVGGFGGAALFDFLRRPSAR